MGDARTYDIPPCDLAFLDSSHEGYFAAWYFEHVIPRSRLVMVHDITIREPNSGALVPKAPFLSIREAYYVLQALGFNKQRFASVADLATELPAGIVASLPSRYETPGITDRSIVFRGHGSSPEALRLADAQAKIYYLQERLLFGDREDVLEGVYQLVASDAPLFTRLQALSILTDMGYRGEVYEQTAPSIAIDARTFNVSELGAALDLYTRAYQFRWVRRLLRDAAASSISPGVLGYFRRYYKRLTGLSMTCGLSLLLRRAKTALKIISYHDEIRGRARNT